MSNVKFITVTAFAMFAAFTMIGCGGADSIAGSAGEVATRSSDSLISAEEAAAVTGDQTTEETTEVAEDEIERRGIIFKVSGNPGRTDRFYADGYLTQYTSSASGPLYAYNDRQVINRMVRDGVAYVRSAKTSTIRFRTDRNKRTAIITGEGVQKVYSNGRSYLVDGLIRFELVDNASRNELVKVSFQASPSDRDSKYAINGTLSYRGAKSDILMKWY